MQVGTLDVKSGGTLGISLSQGFNQAVNPTNPALVQSVGGTGVIHLEFGRQARRDVRQLRLDARRRGREIRAVRCAHASRSTAARDILHQHHRIRFRSCSPARSAATT